MSLPVSTREFTAPFSQTAPVIPSEPENKTKRHKHGKEICMELKVVNDVGRRKERVGVRVIRICCVHLGNSQTAKQKY